MSRMARPQIHDALLRQQGKTREQSQHAPRPARVRYTVSTVGVGESRLTGTKAIDFGALMLDEPSFSFGVIAVDSLSVGQLPLCTATVIRWLKNDNGAYIGAEVAFKVECAKTNVHLKFSLTFEGTTLRSTLGNGTGTTLDTGTNSFSGSTLAVNTGTL
jgi:hypothetical protein